MTEELDSNLYEGKEVSAVYKEIMKILPGDHLLFESVSIKVSDCLTKKTTLLATIFNVGAHAGTFHGEYCELEQDLCL